MPQRCLFTLQNMKPPQHSLYNRLWKKTKRVCVMFYKRHVINVCFAGEKVYIEVGQIIRRPVTRQARARDKPFSVNSRGCEKRSIYKKWCSNLSDR